jgi:hypothetical protein
LYICAPRRGEVHRDALERKLETGVVDGRVHALAALLHRPLRQSHGHERRQTAGDIGLDVHEIGVDAEHGRRRDAREHARW